jgi:hypothetical protein
MGLRFPCERGRRRPHVDTQRGRRPDGTAFYALLIILCVLANITVRRNCFGLSAPVGGQVPSVVR